MADIEVIYKGATIKSISASGSTTLETAGKYCEDDITIDYAQPSGSSYVKLAETELTLNTTNTSAAPVASINVPSADLWSHNKVIYVAIRDKAGARSGYFLGSDTWFTNENSANGALSNQSVAARLIYRYENGLYRAAATAYGVYVGYISPDGVVRIYTRYNATYGTIDGTFKVEVFSLLYPENISPFA